MGWDGSWERPGRRWPAVDVAGRPCHALPVQSFRCSERAAGAPYMHACSRPQMHERHDAHSGGSQQPWLPAFSAAPRLLQVQVVFACSACTSRGSVPRACMHAGCKTSVAEVAPRMTCRSQRHARAHTPPPPGAMPLNNNVHRLPTQVRPCASTQPAPPHNHTTHTPAALVVEGSRDAAHMP